MKQQPVYAITTASKHLDLLVVATSDRRTAAHTMPDTVQWQQCSHTTRLWAFCLTTSGPIDDFFYSTDAGRCYATPATCLPPGQNAGANIE